MPALIAIAWDAFLLALTGPLVKRVLLTLGLGVVTYEGFQAALDLVASNIGTNLNSLPADALQLLQLSGLVESVSIILSAISVRIGVSQLSKIQRL